MNNSLKNNISEDLYKESGLKERIIELARKIEKHYSYPQDIEWAMESDQLYILQTRPITYLNAVNASQQYQSLLSLLQQPSAHALQ